MSLKSDLETEVSDILRIEWKEEDATVIPDPADLRLNNHAKHFESATVLYADLDGSTDMVDTYLWWFAAEVYQTYLRCAARIIRSEDGHITAYDGDRVMAVFINDNKNTRAVRAAMKIEYAVHGILRPAYKKQYPNSTFELNHCVGIDTSSLRAARIGVRGFNDLVWVGSAANRAAKLTNIGERPVWITEAVYTLLGNELKTLNGVDMWTLRSWTAMKNQLIYGLGAFHHTFE